MDPGTLIVVILRLIVPVSILRYPLGGYIAAFVLDVFDAPMASLIGGHEAGFGGLTMDYSLLDKLLDAYFLCFAFLISLRWQNNLARKTASLLFWFRAAGVALFAFTGLRSFLFFFPNIFEFFYLYYLLAARWFSRFSLDSLKKLFVILVVLAIPKIFMEHFMHFKELELVEIVNYLTPLEILAPSLLDWLKELF